MLANIHLLFAYDVPRTEDVCLPTSFWFNIGPASQPTAGSMPVNRLRRWLNTSPRLGLLYTCANTWHSTKAVSMLTHSLCRWPGIETALGIIPCFLLHYAGTLYIPTPETPDDTIHWPNAAVMLGYRPRRWTNIIPTKIL